ARLGWPRMTWNKITPMTKTITRIAKMSHPFRFSGAEPAGNGVLETGSERATLGDSSDMAFLCFNGPGQPSASRKGFSFARRAPAQLDPMRHKRAVHTQA